MRSFGRSLNSSSTWIQKSSARSTLSSLTPAPYTIADFAAETAIPEETVKQWLDRLLRKQHLILQGPPGTGKTYVAERLARLLTCQHVAAWCETVQFHPSYGYEDFMHGIRPVVQGRT